MGFHNPAETMRVLADATAHALRAEALLRQALAAAGVLVPERIDLELAKYLEKRGDRKLGFDRSAEFQDPFGTQKDF